MQRQALREFEEFMNDEGDFNRLCDDLFIFDNFPSALPYLDRLITKFSNASLPVDDDGEMAVYTGMLKRREPKMLTYLAREWHEPTSQHSNVEYVEFCRRIAYGIERKFALTPVPER